MPIDYSTVFDTFWRGFFANQIAAEMPVERILASVEMLNLQRVEHPVDLMLCTQMPNLRDLIAPMAEVTVADKEAIAHIPRLRELVLSEGAFTAQDLALVATNVSIVKLHLNGMRLSPDTLSTLHAAPKLKHLSLHRPSGIAASDIAELASITQLRLSEFDDGDLAALARMPKLRTLHLEKVPLHDLGFLAAPKMVSFTGDVRAHDESALELLAKKTQWETFDYPVSDLSRLAGCTKLTSLRVDGSQPLDLNAISHLPVTGIQVYFAPDEQTAKKILERARAVWPGLRSIGYRKDWERTVSPPTQAAANTGYTGASDLNDGSKGVLKPRIGLLGRLFGKDIR